MDTVHVSVLCLDKSCHLSDLPRQPMEQNKIKFSFEDNPFRIQSHKDTPDHFPVVAIPLVLGTKGLGHVQKSFVCSEFHFNSLIVFRTHAMPHLRILHPICACGSICSFAVRSCDRQLSISFTSGSLMAFWSFICSNMKKCTLNNLGSMPCRPKAQSCSDLSRVLWATPCQSRFCKIA